MDTAIRASGMASWEGVTNHSVKVALMARTLKHKIHFFKCPVCSAIAPRKGDRRATTIPEIAKALPHKKVP